MTRSSAGRAAKRVAIANWVNLLFRGQVILAALALNISASGLALNAADALPVGSPCEVAIFLHKGENSERYVTRGTVVRSGVGGVAIQFAQVLGGKALATIAKSAVAPAPGRWLQAYRDYFRVSQSQSEVECRRVFGITRQRFHTLTTASFLGSIAASLVPVWLLRAHLPAASVAIKITLALAYGAFWLLVLQPGVDLAMIRVLRRRSIRSRNATDR
jgi:hypothetical protein